MPRPRRTQKEQPHSAFCALCMPLTSRRGPFERVEARKPDLGASACAVWAGMPSQDGGVI
eukprot:scaffold880_cov112-Isochrysis_galbana.AAC.2